jgi:hyperosmotically inducible periplasmic protein
MPSLIATVVLSVVIALSSGCAGNPSRQSTGEYIDDNATTSRVKRALSDDPQFKFPMVEVKTFKGTAQLSGFVPSSDAKKRAGEIAVTVSGVRTVQNDILVKDVN